ncbi:MAG TPA: hypothetical protein VFN10_22575 [Thermoanaerobaculia bacterium]|nr:hypothetical protein [Thermoanaerobaculia bacterium]
MPNNYRYTYKLPAFVDYTSADAEKPELTARAITITTRKEIVVTDRKKSEALALFGFDSSKPEETTRKWLTEEIIQIEENFGE